jgi:hypothetical protein
MTAAEGGVTRQQVKGKIVVRMLLGALLGAGMAYACLTLAEHWHVSIKHIGWGDLLGGYLGICFFGIGLVLFAMSFNRREVAQSLEGWSAKLPASNDEVRQFRLQAAAMFLAGVMLLTPFLASGTLTGPSALGRGLFIAILVMFAAQTWANVRLWRTGDEFLRHQILVVCTLTFAIVQGALFLWAAAEHLKLVRSLTNWETMTLLLFCYLSVSFGVSMRNRPASLVLPPE